MCCSAADEQIQEQQDSFTARSLLRFGKAQYRLHGLLIGTAFIQQTGD